MLKIKKPKIKQVLPGVFLAVFDNQFDLAMTFCRFQEFYESPKFRNKPFTWNEFIRWYSFTYGERKFSYAEDWNGFNIPSHSLYNAFSSLEKQDDEYTDMMNYICSQVEKILKVKPREAKFYLIGVHTEQDKEEDTKDLINHEVGHGLYYTNEDYKSKADKLLDNLPKKAYNTLKTLLIKKGYGKHVIRDEVQAYLGTGLPNNATAKQKKYLKTYMKPFKELNREYRKNAKVS